MKDFAKIAHPLHLLTQGGVHYQTKIKTKVWYPSLEWEPEQEKAFDMLVTALLPLGLLIT